MKMRSFEEERQWITNEFEEAVFDTSTGLSAEELYSQLQELQRASAGRPRQLVCAEAYAWLLDHVQLEMNLHTPFSVKINIGVDYSGFASGDVFDRALFRVQRKEVLEQLYPKELQRMLEGDAIGLGEIWTDFWHTVPDWEDILQLGFAGLLKRAEAARENWINREDRQESQILFLDSVIICFRAIIRLLERIYRYSLQFDAPEFSACIEKLIHRPPETLYEVMQLSVFYLYMEEIGCERGRTLGPIDRLYYPYVEKDLARGVSLEEIKELFRFFFLHFTATKRFAQQPFTICGSDAEGNDLSNSLSMLILEVYDELCIYDPKIHFRYHKNINEQIFTKVISMIRRGNSSICLINDHAVYAGYEKLGIPVTDAKDYVLLGCYEPVIMGKEEAEIGITWMNLVKCIELALNGGRDMLTGRQIGYESPLEFEDFEAFFAIFLRHMDDWLEFAISFAEKQGIYSTLVNPSPIYSATFRDCIVAGKDVHEYPLQYNNMSLKCFGLATVVDSLVAIRKYCFDRKELSVAQLREILLVNWEGHEKLRQQILQDRDKYGNHLPLPDDMMERITGHLEAKYCGRTLKRGGKLRLGLDSITKCMEEGARTAATPDGRKAGTPVSRNLCASGGMDRGGITAYMQSVLKIPSAAFLNSAILDVILHPSAVEGAKGLRDFKALIRIYFEQGGFAVQGNVMNSEILRNAQADPERYATLQVRVCGWNEYFVKMSREKQELFIRQCEVQGT